MPDRRAARLDLPADRCKGYITRPNGERYKVRTLDGTPDVQVLRDARPDREHVFLYGEPGTGKTALVDSAFGTDLVTMLGTEDTEVADFIGGYTTRGGGSYGWTDGALIEAMERGVPLFVDEVGVIAPKVHDDGVLRDGRARRDSDHGQPRPGHRQGQAGLHGARPPRTRTLPACVSPRRC